MRDERAPSTKDEIRKTRLVEARTAVARADRYLGTYPGTTAAALVRDMRQTLKDLIDEVNLL